MPIWIAILVVGAVLGYWYHVVWVLVAPIALLLIPYTLLVVLSYFIRGRRPRSTKPPAESGSP
jgi:hypothetical protein